MLQGHRATGRLNWLAGPEDVTGQVDSHVSHAGKDWSPAPANLLVCKFVNPQWSGTYDCHRKRAPEKNLSEQVSEGLITAWLTGSLPFYYRSKLEDAQRWYTRGKNLMLLETHKILMKRCNEKCQICSIFICTTKKSITYLYSP